MANDLLNHLRWCTRWWNIMSTITNVLDKFMCTGDVCNPMDMGIYIYIYICVTIIPTREALGILRVTFDTTPKHGGNGHGTMIQKDGPLPVQGVEKWIPTKSMIQILISSTYIKIFCAWIYDFKNCHMNILKKHIKLKKDYNTLTIFDLKDLRYYLSPTFLDCPYGTIVSILDCSRRSAWSSPRAWA